MVAAPAEIEHQYSTKERLRSALRDLGYFWVGEDVRATGPHLIKPGETAIVRGSLSRACLPPIDLSTLESDPTNLAVLFGVLSYAERSRGCQGGAVVHIDESRVYLADALVEKGVLGVIDTEVTVVGGRPVLIREGDGLVSLYSNHGAEMLVGSQLEQRVGNGIEVTGDYGKDWYLAGNDGQPLERDRAKSAMGVGLRVGQYWEIPPGEEPIAPFAAGDLATYRRSLASHVLKPVSQDDLHQREFLIGETISTLVLGEGLNAIINPSVRAGGTFIRHTFALVLHAVRTAWPIRVELIVDKPQEQSVGRTLLPRPDDYTNTWILVHFFKDRNLSSQN